MGTTVWIDDDVRRQLRRLQDTFGTPSVNATLQRLLAEPAMGAHAIFHRHRNAIATILARHHLHGLVAFGSRARGDARPDSDLDLAVLVSRTADPLALLAAEADLEELTGVPVHLVERRDARVRAAIKREGVPFAA